MKSLIGIYIVTFFLNVNTVQAETYLPEYVIDYALTLDKSHVYSLEINDPNLLALQDENRSTANVTLKKISLVSGELVSSWQMPLPNNTINIYHFRNIAVSPDEQKICVSFMGMNSNHFVYLFDVTTQIWKQWRLPSNTEIGHFADGEMVFSSNQKLLFISDNIQYKLEGKRLIEFDLDTKQFHSIMGKLSSQFKLQRLQIVSDSLFILNDGGVQVYSLNTLKKIKTVKASGGYRPIGFQMNNSGYCISSLLKVNLRTKEFKFECVNISKSEVALSIDIDVDSIAHGGKAGISPDGLSFAYFHAEKGSYCIRVLGAKNGEILQNIQHDNLRPYRLEYLDEDNILVGTNYGLLKLNIKTGQKVIFGSVNVPDALTWIDNEGIEYQIAQNENGYKVLPNQGVKIWLEYTPHPKKEGWYFCEKAEGTVGLVYQFSEIHFDSENTATLMYAKSQGVQKSVQLKRK